MKRYKAIIPFIPSMGSINPIIVNESPMETKQENLLWKLNSMRDHDGLKPLTSIPRGVKFVPLDN